MATKVQLEEPEDERCWSILFAGFISRGDSIDEAEERADTSFRLLKKRGQPQR